MPALTIVTFTDADGDEFPVAIPGYVTGWSREEIEAEARAHVDELVESGDWRPTLPLTLANIDEPE
jgi:hypothetical protein